MKKLVKIILLIVIVMVGTYFLLDYKTRAGGSDYSLFGGSDNTPTMRTKDLIGTGKLAAERYKFASSTNQYNWDTLTNNYPNVYGATTSAAFLTNKANMVSIYGVFAATNTDSYVSFDFAVSNDSNCNEASSTANVALWWPIPDTASTTDSSFIRLGNMNLASTTATIKPGAIGNTPFSFTFRDINHRCMKVRAYNSSTTDDSSLWIQAVLNE